MSPTDYISTKQKDIGSAYKLNLSAIDEVMDFENQRQDMNKKESLAYLTEYNLGEKEQALIERHIASVIAPVNPELRRSYFNITINTEYKAI